MGAQPEAEPSTSRAPSLPRSNYVDIQENHGAIKGTWELDTRLQVPESLLRPLTDEKQQRPNLKLQARHGSVQASVSLVGPSDQRANIELETTHGKVVFKLVRPLSSIPASAPASRLALALTTIRLFSPLHSSHVHTVNHSNSMLKPPMVQSLSAFQVTSSAPFGIAPGTAKSSSQRVSSLV